MFSSFGEILNPSADEKAGWYMVKADDTIGSYYKWLYSRAFASWNPCMNGCHITFISGEKDDRIVSLAEIGTYVGRKITFFYTNQVWTNGRAFWLSSLCTELDDIRIELGLRPKILYHITLGNTKNLEKSHERL